MAAAPYHIDSSAYLEDLLAEASPDVMRQMMQDFINSFLSGQVDSECGADYNTPSTNCVNSRNGYRHRQLATRVGSIDVAVPKLRQGSFFPERLLERITRVK